MHHTDHRAGDPPKPPFPIESIEKPNKSGNQPQNSRKKKPLFTSLNVVPWRRQICSLLYRPKVCNLRPISCQALSPSHTCNTRDLFFLGKKAPGRAAPHRSPDWGCSNKLVTIIQISRYPIWRCRWDGWRDPGKSSKSRQPWFMVDGPF